MEPDRTVGIFLTLLFFVAFSIAALTVTVTAARGQLGPEYMARPHEVVIVDVKQEKVYRNPMAVYEDRDACENAIEGMSEWLDAIAKIDPKLLTNVEIPYPKSADRGLLGAVADLVVQLLHDTNRMPTLTASCAPVGKRA